MSDLLRRLEERKAANAFRELKYFPGGVDFFSNDYLGFSRSETIARRTEELLKECSVLANGSTGSRLVSGNSLLAADTEEYLAKVYNSGSALIFNSGYDANLGLISSAASRNDTIFYDEYVHASIRDGIRLSFAKSFSFRHNDVPDLLQKLERAKGNVYIVTESVFSMDGDRAPLEELVELCAQKGFYLVVDEAHATGCLGENGKGYAVAENILPHVFARVVTFGKALGVHGAAVLGNAQLKEFLVNFARSFIYTTALPPHGYAAIRAAHEEMERAEAIRETLAQRIRFFRNCEWPGTVSLIPSETAIQSFVIPGNDRVKSVAEFIQQEGFSVAPILSPTVPAGKERIRICLHAFNTEEEIQNLAKAFHHA
jgi:8-amino-7-oxononanoate synthase